MSVKVRLRWTWQPSMPPARGGGLSLMFSLARIIHVVAYTWHNQLGPRDL